MTIRIICKLALILTVVLTFILGKLNALPVSLDIRVVNGKIERQGRLEVFYNGSWGTVCDDGFTNTEAAVVCRMLGYTGKSFALNISYFGEGHGTIAMDDVKCKGSEPSLFQCNFTEESNCLHREDVGVDCQGPNIHTPIKLVGGRNKLLSEGHVEVFYNNTWGPICAYGFDSNDAEVVCRMMQYDSKAAIAETVSYVRSGTDRVWLSDLRCTGNEPDIAYCIINGWGYHERCSPGQQNAGVICVHVDDCASFPCQNNGMCTDGVDSYTCDCMAGYKGHSCEIDVDECASSPCQNNGTCTHGVDTYSCTCVPGFTGINCQSDINCRNVLAPSNGAVHTGNHTTYNSIVIYTCEAGYKIVNHYERTCLDSGRWSGEEPKCIKDCGVPSRPPNGDLDLTDTVVGSIAYFHCTNGYWVNGINTSICLDDGHWSNPPPVCEQIDCKAPDDPVNGYSVAADTSFGTVAIYICNVGYTLDGRSRTRCLADGTWDEIVPDCNIVDCGLMGIPLNGKILISDEEQTFFGSSVTYTCEDGYRLVGYSKRTCLASGLWSGSDPSCKKVNEDTSVLCPPSTDRQGLDWNSSSSGHVVTRPCMEGFQGQISRECSMDGNWFIPVNSCVRMQLVDIQQRLHAIYEDPSTNEVSFALHHLSNVTASAVETKTITPGELEQVTSLLANIVKISKTVAVTQEQSENFVSIASDILDESNRDVWNTLSQTSINNKKDRPGADEVLEVIGNFAETLVQSLNMSTTPRRTISKTNLVLTVSTIGPDNFEDLYFPGNSSSLPEWLKLSASGVYLANESLTGATSYSAVFYRNLTGLMSPRTETFPRNETNSSVTSVQEINSAVLALKLSSDTEQLATPIEVTLEHFQSAFNNPSCRFWNYASKSWDTTGCKIKYTNETITVCECNHLTNFAVLMTPWKQDTVVSTALDDITLVGCSISLVCLLLTVGSHLFLWRYMKTDRVVLLLNLSVALAISYIVFLAGVDRTENKELCTAVAILLQYIYLVVFCSMLVEGIETTIMVIFVFNKRSRLKWLIPSAWALPGVIVGISISVTDLEGYGTDDFCWLSKDNGLIWAFVGPAICILLINTTFIVIIMKKMLGASVQARKNTLEKAKTSVRCLCILMPLMGCTWILGIFYVNESTVWVQYVFAVCNSLQGMVIFILHCLYNKQMRAAIRERQKHYSNSFSTTSYELNKPNKNYFVPDTDEKDDQRVELNSFKHEEETPLKDEKTILNSFKQD